MRTTIDLQPDLHQMAKSIARDRHQSLSETINQLLASVLVPTATPAISISVSATTGLATIRIGRVITADDVRALDENDGVARRRHARRLTVADHIHHSPAEA